MHVDWPAEFREWATGRASVVNARAATHRRSTPHEKAGVRESTASAALAMANPPDGATYLIDPTLRREFQALPLRVTATRSGAIEWFVNGVPAGVADASGALAWPLTPGKHRITARDESGRTVQSSIEVR